MRVAITLVALLLAVGVGKAFAAPRIVVTVTPLHSLVAQVTEGVIVPDLLLPGVASPHAYALKPSDARSLSEAEVVFWIGEPLEGFLHDALGTLAPRARAVALIDADGVTRLPTREDAIWEAHDHGHGQGRGQDKGHDGGHDNGHDKGHDHDTPHHDDAIDAHVWLDPGNAAAMVRAIAATLAELDPANAARYGANADAATRRIETLDAELRLSLEPLRDRPFLVFHDAYQYLDRHYGLAAAGSVTVGASHGTGPRHLRALRRTIKERDVACLFTEPQFAPGIAHTLVEGTSVRVASLDPLGATVEPGPTAYEAMMRSLAGAMRDCLNSR